MLNSLHQLALILKFEILVVSKKNLQKSSVTKKTLVTTKSHNLPLLKISCTEIKR